MMSKAIAAGLLAGVLRIFIDSEPRSYSALILDADTGQPVEFVSVGRIQDTTVTESIMVGADGRFTLPYSPVHLRLNRVGYSALEVFRTPRPDGQPDTIRLIPQPQLLTGVTVKPGRPATLSSIAAARHLTGSGLLPGQEMAVLIRPPVHSGAQYCQLQQIRLYLNEKPRQGRVRVRLVQALSPAGGSPEATRPGSLDLLPTAYEFTAEQLATLPKKRLVIDLNQYNLAVPAEGVCILVECLLSDPALTLQSIRLTPATKAVCTIQAVNSVGAKVVTQASIWDFPSFEASRQADLSQTWHRPYPGGAWVQRLGGTMQIRAELDVIVK